MFRTEGRLLKNVNVSECIDDRRSITVRQWKAEGKKENKRQDNFYAENDDKQRGKS